MGKNLGDLTLLGEPGSKYRFELLNHDNVNVTDEMKFFIADYVSPPKMGYFEILEFHNLLQPW